MKKIVKINSVLCLQCKLQIEDAFKKQKISAEVDIESGIVNVDSPVKITDKEILNILTSCGFDGSVL